MEDVGAFGMKVFKLGGEAAALGFQLGFLVMAMDLGIALFPHKEELFPNDGDHSCYPESSGSVRVK